MKNYVFFILCLFVTLTSRADYINLIRADQCETIIEVFIEEGEVRITFEIGERDHQYFKWIVPSQYPGGIYDEARKEELLKAFFREGFVLRADGRRIEGSLRELRRIPRNYRQSLYTGQVDTTNLKISDHVIFAEFVYPIGKPGKLSIEPPIKEDKEITYANIGFVTYHKLLPVNDLRYLSKEETLHLDWSDPWYSKYENRNIARHHQNSLMSFLYMDPYEVRHEVLVRLKDLEYWLDLPYGIDDVIPIEDLDKVKQTVADFLIRRNRVIVDGEVIQPILDKSHFVEVKLSGIQIQSIPAPISYSSAIIGVIFVYPNPGLPQQVMVEWDMWNDQIQTIPCVMSDPAGPLPYDLTYPDDQILVWTNYLKNYSLPTVSQVEVTQASIKLPVISLVFLALILFQLFRKFRGKTKKWRWGWLAFGLILCVISYIFYVEVPIPFAQKKSFNQPESRNLLTNLLKNTYRAFDYRSESDIYDKLAISLEGDLLREVYIQTKQSMVLENQGGIQVKLKSVDLLDVEELEDDELPKDALAYKCQWVVEGDVGHWGHIHRRINQYEAVMRILPTEGSWKMYDLEIIEEQRTL